VETRTLVLCHSKMFARAIRLAPLTPLGEKGELVQVFLTLAPLGERGKLVQVFLTLAPLGERVARRAG